MRLLLSQNNLIVQDLEIFKNIKKNKKNYYLYFAKKKSLKEKNLIYYNSIDLLTKINIAIIMGIFLIVPNIIIYQEKSKRFIKRYKKKQKDLNNKFDLITQKEILIKLNNYEEMDSKKYCYSTMVHMVLSNLLKPIFLKINFALIIVAGYLFQILKK